MHKKDLEPKVKMEMKTECREARRLGKWVYIYVIEYLRKVSEGNK